MVANQIDSGLGHQGSESGDKIERFEEEVCGAVGIGVFLAAESFELVALMGLSGDDGVH